MSVKELSIQETCRIYPVVLLIGTRVHRIACNIQEFLLRANYMDLADEATCARVEQQLPMLILDVEQSFIIDDVQCIPALQNLLIQRTKNYTERLMVTLRQKDDAHSKQLLYFFLQLDSWMISHTLISTQETSKDNGLFVQKDPIGISAIIPSFTYLFDQLKLENLPQQ